MPPGRLGPGCPENRTFGAAPDRGIDRLSAGGNICLRWAQSGTSASQGQPCALLRLEALRRATVLGSLDQNRQLEVGLGREIEGRLHYEQATVSWVVEGLLAAILPQHAVLIPEPGEREKGA